MLYSPLVATLTLASCFLVLCFWRHLVCLAGLACHCPAYRTGCRAGPAFHNDSDDASLPVNCSHAAGSLLAADGPVLELRERAARPDSNFARFLREDLEDLDDVLEDGGPSMSALMNAKWLPAASDLAAGASATARAAAAAQQVGGTVGLNCTLLIGTCRLAAAADDRAPLPMRTGARCCAGAQARTRHAGGLHGHG